MARQSPRLTLIFTPAAQRDQRDIYAYNAATYGPDHAARYLAFLNAETAKLETDYPRGRAIPNRPDLQFLTIRKGRGHGHVAIYRVTGQGVEIIGYFHTAQDWQGKAQRGEL